MSTSTAVQWRKEVRELLPWWCATAVTMAVGWALMRPDVMPADWLFRWAVEFSQDGLLKTGLLVYAAGAVTLGAMAIGHEYSHHTLTHLLAQPIARARVLRTKLVVLAAMLITLGALAFAAWGPEMARIGVDTSLGTLMVFALPMACGLVLAPWLTMVGRGPLGGAVFATVLPAVIWLLGIYFELPFSRFVAIIGVLAAIGAVMTRHTFLRLEVAGDQQHEVDLFAWVRMRRGEDTAARARAPFRAMLGKELRLQQFTLVTSGVYVVAWALVLAGRRLAPDVITESASYIVAGVHGGLVPLLAGAVASAEERRLRTADWHLLVPVAAWKQWLVKSGVALSLALVLGIVLPAVLELVASEPGVRSGFDPVVTVLLCLTALYLSSLSTSALGALLLTMPAVVVAVAAIVVGQFLLLSPQTGLALPAIRWVAHAMPIIEIDRFAYAWWMRRGPTWVATGLALILLAFAFANHRTADRSRGRTARQAGWLAAYGVAALVGLSLIGQLFAVWIRATLK